MPDAVHMSSVRKERVDRGLLNDPKIRQAWQEAMAEKVKSLRNSNIIDGVQATALQVLQRAKVAAAKQFLMSDGRR